MATELIIFSHSTIPFTILGFFLFLYAFFSLSRSLRNKTIPFTIPYQEASETKPSPSATQPSPLPSQNYATTGSRRRMASDWAPPPLRRRIALAKTAHKYGPILSLRLGVHPTLIVSSWEIAKQCFTVNYLAFAGRPKILAFEIMGYNVGMFGTYSYGPHYCHMRKIVTQEVRSNQRLEMLKHLREYPYKRWVELNNNDGGQNSESVPLLQHVVGGSLSDSSDEKLNLEFTLGRPSWNIQQPQSSADLTLLNC